MVRGQVNKALTTEEKARRERIIRPSAASMDLGLIRSPMRQRPSTKRCMTSTGHRMGSISSGFDVLVDGDTFVGNIYKTKSEPRANLPLGRSAQSGLLTGSANILEGFCLIGQNKKSF